MSIAWLSCLVLSVGVAQENGLAISNPRPTYGYLGAARPKGKGILPGDTAHFTFEIKNLKLNGDNKAAYSIAIEIRDASGKIFYEQKPYNAVAQNFFGGNSLPCSAHIEVPLDAKPGPVTWKLTVTDRTTKKSVTEEGKGMILPAEFGIVQVGLFADVEARTPMPAVGVIGNTSFLQFSIVGAARDKETKQPNVDISMRILDENGKETMAKPLTGSINKGIDANDRFLTMQLGLTLNRVGRFTIEVNATDRATGKTSRVSYGIRVLGLE
jgi:hypothetical protein